MGRLEQLTMVRLLLRLIVCVKKVLILLFQTLIVVNLILRQMQRRIKFMGLNLCLGLEQLKLIVLWQTSLIVLCGTSTRRFKTTLKRMTNLRLEIKQWLLWLNLVVLMLWRINLEKKLWKIISLIWVIQFLL